jgi:hypothetical protein
MATKYHPRRAAKRWMEDAPSWVLSCHDNKGGTADRYTVWLYDKLFPQEYSYRLHISYLSMSEYPTHPQGISMYGEIRAVGACRDAKTRCRWLDFPEDIRQHVIDRWTGA